MLAQRSRLTARALAVTGLLAAAFTAAAGGQPLPQGLGDWQLEYIISGGISSYAHALTISRNGDLQASDTRLGDDVTGRASADLVAATTAFLKTAREAKKTAPMPDAIGTSLVLTSGGRKYELQISRDIEARFDAAWDAAVQGALVGSWRESGSKLCKPSAQVPLPDTPIDDLTFKTDGTFGLMWRGGGAHTTGIPHKPVAYPDYTGEYTAIPATGAIRLRSTNQLVKLRDFSGDGRFRVTATELTLTNIWLGTRESPQKPDICELTFARK